MHICFDSRLVGLELIKRGWQLSNLATQAGLSEPTVRAVVRGCGVSIVTALKVVRALERNPPNERLMALLNWHEAHQVSREGLVNDCRRSLIRLISMIGLAVPVAVDHGCQAVFLFRRGRGGEEIQSAHCCS